MAFIDCLWAAIAALRLNLMRSILTTLGVIIGVASVIVMSAINAGAQQRIEEEIDALGSTTLTIAPGARRRGGRALGADAATMLSERELKEIAQSSPDIVAATGEVRASGIVVAEGIDWPTTIEGVHETFPAVRNWPVTQGAFFTARDLATGRRVAVIGATVANEVFAGNSPLGATVRIGGIPFEVIGVLKARERTVFGRDEDDVIVAPASTVRARLVGRDATVPDQLDRIRVLYKKNADLDKAEKDLSEQLRGLRNIRPGQEDNFRIFNVAEFVAARNETTKTFGVLLAATAAISLVVGGIGIMNIMLVSVTERTREIGLRLAVGARKRDILMQFLVEAILLCLIGGLIGLTVGLCGAYLVGAIAGWAVLIDGRLVLLAIAASGLVGICFGYFPARRAASASPIEALRYE